MGQDAGDTNDRRQLVASYGPRVYGFILRLIGNRDVAEDLTQEAMARALRGLGSYRPEGKFQAWVFRIAMNVTRDWIRRRPHEPALGLDESDDGPVIPQAGVDPPEGGIERRERAAAVDRALARLGKADREVLLMRFYGELAFKDIARVTGEPLGTVLARAHRALKKLADLLPGDLS